MQLQTELKILSFLLKGRVYPGDLWEIVGECIIEDKQETSLREHRSICIGGSKQKEHVIAECLLMGERRKRGQMEVSLYSQALEHLRQHPMCEFPQFWHMNKQSELYYKQSISLHVCLNRKSGLLQQP